MSNLCHVCGYHLTPESYCDKCDGVGEFSPWKFTVGTMFGYGASKEDCERQVQFILHGFSYAPREPDGREVAVFPNK